MSLDVMVSPSTMLSLTIFLTLSYPWCASLLCHRFRSTALLDFLPSSSLATFYTFPLPIPLCASPSCVNRLLFQLTVEPSAPVMVLSSSGPPGPKRPKSSTASATSTRPLPSSSASATAEIFSPVPSRPSTSWFSLLASPAPSPLPQLPPAAIVTASPLPAPHHAVAASQLVTVPGSNLVDNHPLVTNISPDAHLSTGTLSKDPWARAHARVCAHANQDCAACSISLVCCSCRSLRHSPGLPPSSPAPVASHVTWSRSASPALFRNVGNGSPPACFDQSFPEHDDDAYSRALAECDTCDNSSCVRGADEPATWTITVEQFDEGLEETYDRTFRACAACNRSCKKSFMTYKIKSRHFDNSTRNPLPPSASQPLSDLPPADNIPPARLQPPAQPVTASPALSRPPTPPLEVFAIISYSHRVSCNHAFEACSVCSLGIVCCGCNKLHTAPARLKLQCAACRHFACAACSTPYCCSCHKPWFPSDSPTLVLAQRFRGGARSTKSSKKGSSSSSQSSGPGSLATAHSARNSPDPFAAPTAQVTQSSSDEINAFADVTVKLVGALRDETSRAAVPSPSSNMPPIASLPAPVFSRPIPPVIVGGTEDVPTAVPSRAPSRAASVVSVASTGDAGISDLLQPDPFAQPAPPPCT